MSWATRRTMRFSKPRPAASEYGRLSGSAQTRSSRASTRVHASVTSAHASTRQGSRSWQRENIPSPTLLRLLLQIRHDVRKPCRGCLIARVDVVRDDGARPSADAGQHGDVLLAVGAAERHRLPDDP